MSYDANLKEFMETSLQVVREDARQHISRKQIADKIEAIDHEIEWNIRRLGNLVLSDEDRRQTEDLIAELREECLSLAWCFNVSA